MNTPPQNEIHTVCWQGDSEGYLEILVYEVYFVFLHKLKFYYRGAEQYHIQIFETNFYLQFHS